MVRLLSTLHGLDVNEMELYAHERYYCQLNDNKTSKAGNFCEHEIFTVFVVGLIPQKYYLRNDHSNTAHVKLQSCLYIFFSFLIRRVWDCVQGPFVAPNAT